MKLRGVCKAGDCGRLNKGFNLCSKHYQRFKNSGDPSKIKLEHNMSPKESYARRIFSLYKSSAKGRSLNFDLSFEEFKNLIFKDCFYCGHPPNNYVKTRHKHLNIKHSGVDRINSSQGYNTRNCVPCCATCNAMKMDLDMSKFLVHIQMIWEHDNRNGIFTRVDSEKGLSDELYKEFIR